MLKALYGLKGVLKTQCCSVQMALTCVYLQRVSKAAWVIELTVCSVLLIVSAAEVYI